MLVAMTGRETVALTGSQLVLWLVSSMAETTVAWTDEMKVAGSVGEWVARLACFEDAWTAVSLDVSTAAR